jgi:hypothetical protein
LVRRSAILRPGLMTSGVSRRSDQDWPEATVERRFDLDRFEHGAISSRIGLGRQLPAMSTICGAVLRLAHKLISGSSVTAWHNPECTAETIEETGSHFLPARKTSIVSSTTRHPASGALLRVPKLGEAVGSKRRTDCKGKRRLKPELPGVWRTATEARLLSDGVTLRGARIRPSARRPP